MIIPEREGEAESSRSRPPREQVNERGAVAHQLHYLKVGQVHEIDGVEVGANSRARKLASSGPTQK
jgi:hypothetical protein